MNPTNEIEEWLARLTAAQREELFRRLRAEFAIHPLERQLHAKAEIILEAIQRAPPLTLRMIRGVIAEAAFRAEVVTHLKGWREMPSAGGLAYDYLLKDKKGSVRVQVKLQRSTGGQPMKAMDMFVVETQKTRGGKRRQSGQATRPYRFGEFDVLAVAMYPSTHRWDIFGYTVADWLIPGKDDASEIHKLQPVAPEANDDWTDDFNTVVRWFRSHLKKTIRIT
jgi:hypothetical protein